MLFPFSWKWKEPSPIKIIERTQEETTQALYVGSEGAILRRHLLEKELITKRCDELGLRWRKEFFENGAAAFEQQARPNHSAEQERVAYLDKKIARGSRRSTPSEIGSGRRPGKNGTFVGSGLVIRFGATAREAHFTTTIVGAWQKPLPQLGLYHLLTSQFVLPPTGAV